MPEATPIKTEQDAKRTVFFCLLSLLAGIIIAGSGCSRSPYGAYPVPPANYPAQSNYTPPGGFAATPPASPPATGPGSVFANQQTSPQLLELQRRVKQLDIDNSQLTTQLAQAQQQAQAMQQKSDLLAKQLQDMTAQNKQLLASRNQLEDQARGLQASMNARGGARLTANNSVASSLGGLQIPGVQTSVSGGLVRLRLPADQVFVPGSAQLSQTSTNTLDQIAQVLATRFSRQRVAIEGHTDTSPPSGGGTLFSLSSSQANAVMTYLSQRGNLPSGMLFVVAHGPNHPIAQNQTPAGRAENRRIEIVVYPETF